jgi:hypothetical protein
MTTTFDLSGAHPEYAAIIESTLRELQERYPWAPLKSVSLYDPSLGDTSIAATYPGGEIRLNSYWFSGDPDRLNDAAKRDLVVNANGVKIGWHGRMVQEPEHVLHHEFGHIVAQGIPPDVLDPWQRERWLAATRDPMQAPAGYALSHDPEEWFAEMFALCSLGLASAEETAEMFALLNEKGRDWEKGAW